LSDRFFVAFLSTSRNLRDNSCIMPRPL
jgi:hypothetical protein